eukprot:CAMPEP_0174384764 /NCGR_PEP_ID=MMETSP0811_2-20130205/126136_1 /TAXON_ID=73025 ORGANISM="Eutreptiella gymnastica-like, Strain CCMP1594" /NCGR_SAMPLE_ID=MMETSP0811_2 /ASSEMBLY_ACC=CAM_ASM_000667 /LENGTH=71 /DNA_ID=CAMNT_0015538827 /DNA_START=1403 /DNA_END=1618 /DNA_ORIENTATION=+
MPDDRSGVTFVFATRSVGVRRGADGLPTPEITTRPPTERRDSQGSPSNHMGRSESAVHTKNTERGRVARRS